MPLLGRPGVVENQAYSDSVSMVMITFRVPLSLLMAPQAPPLPAPQSAEAAGVASGAFGQPRVARAGAEPGGCPTRPAAHRDARRLGYTVSRKGEKVLRMEEEGRRTGLAEMLEPKLIDVCSLCARFLTS